MGLLLVLENETDYYLYFVASGIIAVAILFYFISLFQFEEIEIDSIKQMIRFQYPYSSKKTKEYDLKDILGYYLNVEYGDSAYVRSLIIVLINKKEYVLNEFSMLNYNEWQDHFITYYPMLSYKKYNVYSPKRKQEQLDWYFSHYNQSPKLNHDYFTGHSYIFPLGAIGFLIINKYENGLSFNEFDLGVIVISGILYLWFKRMAGSKPGKEDLNKK